MFDDKEGTDYFDTFSYLKHLHPIYYYLSYTVYSSSDLTWDLSDVVSEEVQKCSTKHNFTILIEISTLVYCCLSSENVTHMLKLLMWPPGKLHLRDMKKHETSLRYNSSLYKGKKDKSAYRKGKVWIQDGIILIK